MPLQILYEDEQLIAVDKPAGFIVHQPENAKKVSRLRCCLPILRNQTGGYVYPVHRLDRATSGVLLFAKDSDSARNLHDAWQARLVKKTYACLVRGFFAENYINRALKDENGEPKPAETYFQPLFQKEIATGVEKYPTARYTLTLASPISGRFHQIRRHLARAAHPVIGDKRHGDSAHNRYFDEQLKMPLMYLRATELKFPHPTTGSEIRIAAPWNGKWHKLFDWLGYCPVIINWPT